jgi:exonuclease SbcC
MGFFNFIKELFREKEIKEIEKEKIDFSEIPNWINKKRENLSIKEQEIFKLIKEKQDFFIETIEEKSKIVENVNLKLKKADDRIISASEEGRKKYLLFVEIFLGNLKELELENFEKYSKDVDFLFLNFNKNSDKSYERATLLIGKEMASIRNSIKLFSKELIKLFEENKYLLENIKLISIINSDLIQLEKNIKEIQKVEDILSKLNKKLTDIEEENSKIIHELNETKKSKFHLENLEIQNKLNFLKEELEKEIINLRQEIDFKALTNFYHIFENKMKLVQEFKDNFLRNIKQENDELVLENLLSESKLDNEEIYRKIKEIQNKKIEIIEIEEKIIPDEVQKLEDQINKLKESNEITNIEKAKQEKVLSELKLIKEEITKKIKEKSQELGGEVLD